MNCLLKFNGLFLFIIMSNYICSQTDFNQLANKIAFQTANIKEGEIVLITGSVRDSELLEDLAIQVRKVGAFPLISINSDRLIRSGYTEVPEKYDSQRPEWDVKLTEIIDAEIDIDITEDEGLLKGIAPERIAAHRKAHEGVSRMLMDRKIKYVNLGNGLYPTTSLAKKFNVPKEELSVIFWNGINTDYAVVRKNAEAVSNKFKEGKMVRITTPSGTDLTAEITGRPVTISDGMITDENIMSGPANVEEFLPAGEVYFTPVKGKVNGRVVVDKYYLEGELINDLTLTFKDGKVNTMTAASDISRLKELYDKAGEGKDEFAAIDIGINPNVKIPEGSNVQAWMANGMITVGIGNNLWSGGDNAVSYYLNLHLPNATVKIDDKPVVENGVLKP